MKAVVKRFLGQRSVQAIRRLQRTIQSVYLGLGHAVECPNCARSFSHFLDYNKRKNVWCPACGSLERHRLLFLFLRDEIRFFDSRLKVLHFAPERCLSQAFKLHHDCTTADLLVSPLATISSAPDVVMSVTDIRFADCSFDVVFCNHVLEHVREDELAMKEILRVLRKGGWAVLQVPINVESEVTLEDPNLTADERAQHYGFKDHVRLYGLDYGQRLRECGFVVQESDFARRADAGKYRIDKEEVIYVCRKP